MAVVSGYRDSEWRPVWRPAVRVKTEPSCVAALRLSSFARNTCPPSRETRVQLPRNTPRPTSIEKFHCHLVSSALLKHHRSTMNSRAVQCRVTVRRIIMRELSHLAVAVVLFGTAVGNAFAASATSYTTTVHLRDGKQVVCAVNEPASTQKITMQTLSRRDRNEAEVIATAPLRRLPNNRNNYPSPISAPRVQCA